MANHTSRVILDQSPRLSDIDSEIQRFLSELKPYIQELARQTKELSDLKESYCREKEAVRKRLFDVGIYQFDDVRELAAVRQQRQELDRRVGEMLSLSDQCTAQIAKVIATIDVKINKKKQSSRSEELGGSKLGDLSTRSRDDDDSLGLGQKGSTDLEIGKEDLENAQVILTAAKLSIQDVEGLYESANGGTAGGTEEESTSSNDANRGRNDNLEVESLENWLADIDIEEEDMEINSKETDGDSDRKIKLKRKNEEEEDDDDDQKKPTKAMKLKDHNPPVRE